MKNYIIFIAIILFSALIFTGCSNSIDGNNDDEIENAVDTDNNIETNKIVEESLVRYDINIIEDEVLKDLINNQIVDLLIMKEDLKTTVSIKYTGEDWFTREFCLTDDEKFSVINNDKYTTEYLNEIEQDLITAQLNFYITRSEILCSGASEKIKVSYMEQPETFYPEPTVELISQSELLYEGGEFTYKYFILDNPIYGCTILYSIYDKNTGYIQNIWGCSENISNCTAEEFIETTLLKDALSEQYESFTIVDVFGNSDKLVDKYLNTGQTAILRFSNIGSDYEHYCCTDIYYSELSVFDVIGEEHYPEKLFEQYARK